MIKNIFLPLILIILTSAATIYFWYEKLPLSLFAVVGFITLGLGSLYFSCFIFYKIFPDKRNKPLASIPDIFLQYQKENVYTKGSILGTILAIILTISGIYLWITVAEKYKNYELNTYRKFTRGLIIDIGYSKGIGTYRKYEYQDESGNTHTDKFSNNTYNIGDTLPIMYSTNRPIINKPLMESEGE